MRGFPRVVWVLLALLAVSAMLLTLGRRENVAFPAMDSFSPSGTAAFAELLRREGYRVEVDRRERPRLASGDLAIVFCFQGAVPSLETAQGRGTFERAFGQAVRRGTHALILPLQEDFRTASLAVWNKPYPIKRAFGGPEKRVSASEKFLRDASERSFAVWTGPRGPFALVAKVGKGSVILAGDSLPMTNRFLDRANNAEVALSLVRLLAAPNGRVVFTEGAFNSRAQSLLGTLGEWAEAAWLQILFLFGVIIYTLGKRFGLPEERRAPQRGTRELLDAVAETQRRARHGQSALQAAIQAADARLRRALKVPSDTPIAEVGDRLPETLRKALREAELAATEPKLRAREALPLCQRLEREVADFLSDRSQMTPRRR